MNKVLELVSVDNEKVVIKVNAKDPLTVAMNPEFSSDMAYITVTRGNNHTLTVIKEDGKTWSINWGNSGTTLCSDGVNKMKWRVVDFIQKECGIPYGITGTITEASIFYNSNFKKWQLTCRDNKYHTDHCWYDDARCAEDVMEKAKKVLVVNKWAKGVAQTGIDIWRAIL